MSNIAITAANEGLTVAALLRQLLPDHSWSQVRRVVAARRIFIGAELCLDPARKLKEGEQFELRAAPAAVRHEREKVVLRHVDAHLVVVEKPAGIATVRHPTERDWPAQRKALEPTLEDLVPKLLAAREHRRSKGPLVRLRIVHRLDKGTSGLMVFARTAAAEQGLGRQFRAHTVTRRYLAVVAGYLGPQTIATRLVRDRGDGRRGSTKNMKLGKEAITHVEVVERLSGYTLLACRLETGRTHQIRIHLAERGHPVCGDKVYLHKPDGSLFVDKSAAPRLALHAAELGFRHPATGEDLHWSMPLPADLQEFVNRLHGQATRKGPHGSQMD